LARPLVERHETEPNGEWTGPNRVSECSHAVATARGVVTELLGRTPTSRVPRGLVATTLLAVIAQVGAVLLGPTTVRLVTTVDLVPPVLGAPLSAVVPPEVTDALHDPRVAVAMTATLAPTDAILATSIRIDSTVGRRSDHPVRFVR
jgi:hypothetical protein